MAELLLVGAGLYAMYHFTLGRKGADVSHLQSNAYKSDGLPRRFRSITESGLTPRQYAVVTTNMLAIKALDRT